MATLRITVEWLDGTYHGREWPPSPFRMYQAMLAGAAVHRRGNRAFEAALRHLETLSPPLITAPRASARVPVTAAVPNNDGDRVLALLAKGKRDRARAVREKAVTLRARRARSFDGAVTYDWQATALTGEHLPGIATAAACVSALGLGIDVAIARADLVERPVQAHGVRYVPSPTGRRTLNVPYPGAFDDLETRYRALRGRIVDGVVAPVRESAPRTARYACELDLPAIRCEAFALRSPDDRPLAVEGTRAMEIAAMVRHAIGGAARRAGLGDATISELMGHGNGGRIRVQPLPSVGYRDADGRIRRVMLTAPMRVDEEDWIDVVSRLRGELLTPLGQRLAVGALAPVAASDPTVDRYRGEARCWTSATPVVLPGLDHRRGRPRPHRSVRRLLRHAGIPESLLESATMEPAARLAGSAHPARYARPRHLADYPCQHMSVRWKSPVTGPLALGVGSGYGLGLFLPTRD